MAMRTSKAALAEAAALLGKDRKLARRYLVEVQRRAGVAIAFTTIVAAMKELATTDIAAVTRRASEQRADD